MFESRTRTGAAITDNPRSVPERLAEAVLQHRRGAGCISDAIRRIYVFEPQIAEKIRRHHKGKKFERQTTAPYWTRLLREDAAIRSCHELRNSTHLTAAEQRLELDRRSRDEMFGNVQRRRNSRRTRKINELIRVAAPVIDAGRPVYFVTITPGGPPSAALSLIDAALKAARRQSIAFSGLIEVEKSGALSFHGIAFSTNLQQRTRVRETKRAFAEGLISKNFPRAVRGPAIDVRRISTGASLVKRARYTYKSYGTPWNEARRLGLGQRTLFRSCNWRSQSKKNIVDLEPTQLLQPTPESKNSTRVSISSHFPHADGGRPDEINPCVLPSRLDFEYGQRLAPDFASSIANPNDSKFKAGKPGPRRIHASDFCASNLLAALIFLFKSIYRGLLRHLLDPRISLETLGPEVSVESDQKRSSPAGAWAPTRPVPPRSRGPPNSTASPRIATHWTYRVATGDIPMSSHRLHSSQCL